MQSSLGKRFQSFKRVSSYIICVETELEADGRAAYMVTSSHSGWIGVRRVESPSEPNLTSFQRAVQLASIFDPDSTDRERCSISAFDSAKRYRLDAFGNVNGKCYHHDCIFRNCAVQAVVRRDRLHSPAIFSSTVENLQRLSREMDSEITTVVYAVIGVLGKTGTIPWAIVRLCNLIVLDSFDIVQVCINRAIQVLKLTDGVRRVGIQHACYLLGNSCNTNHGFRNVSHSEPLLEG